MVEYIPSCIAAVFLALSICVCCRRAYRRTPGRIFRSDVIVTQVIHQPLPVGQTGIFLPNQSINAPYPTSNPITFPAGPLTQTIQPSPAMHPPIPFEGGRPLEELQPPSYEDAVSSTGAVEYKRQLPSNPNF